MAEAIVASGSAKFVTVACKIPNGLILHLDKLEEFSEPVMGGGTRTTHLAVKTGETHTINGPALKYGEQPSFVIAGGYALTSNIPADFFSEWVKQNATSDAVKNKMIFAHEKEDHARGKAKEQSELQSGLQAIVPDKDARIPKGVKTIDKAA